MRDYERTFGVALFSQVKADWFNASARKYPSSLAAALDDDDIPEAVYRTLVAETRRQPADAAPLLPAPRPHAGHFRPAVLGHLPADREAREALPAGRGEGAGDRRGASPWVADYVALFCPEPERPVHELLPAARQGARRLHGRRRLRRASVRADELQRRLRVGLHDRPRMGPRDALAPGEPRPAFPDGRLQHLHRRDRLDDQRGAAPRAHAEGGAKRRGAPVLPRLRARGPARHVLPPGDVRRVRARDPRGGREGRLPHRRRG